MYYRRNADENLRELERRFAQGDMDALLSLNAARARLGLPLYPQPETASMRVLPSLEWGYNAGLHPDAVAAWGARAIFERGHANLVPDRQSIVTLPGRDEDRARLIDALNGNPPGTGAIFQAQQEVQRLSNMGVLKGNEANEVILYEDDTIVIIGNTNASYGYIYLVGFLKPEIPESGIINYTRTEEGQTVQYTRPAVPWVSVVPTCERCGAEKIRSILTPCEQCGLLLCESSNCRSACDDCGRVICARHMELRERCASCDDPICWSEQCSRRTKECPDCGRIYCRECRDEVANCECQDEEYCEECGELVEECDECGENRCSCEPCSCDEEDEDYEENPVDGRPSREHRSRTETRTCEEPGCNEKTKEEKPYCKKHILQSPYVMRLQQMMKAREAEEAAASKGSPHLSSHLTEHPDSLPIQELLTFLEMEGAKTIDSLAKNLQLDKATVKRYAKYLESQGRVFLRRGKRKGQLFIHLVEEKRRNPDQYLYPHCDNCQVLVVNNIPTHELGCPDIWIDPITQQPSAIECEFCGGSFIPQNRWQTFCSQSCRDSY